MNISVDVSDISLRDGKLSLRAFREEDLEDFYNYAKEPGLGEAAGWFHHESIEESKKILDTFIKDKNILAIEYDGTVIGSIGLHTYDEEFLPDLASKKALELGFVIKGDFQRKGLMTRSLNILIDYLFNNLGIEVLVAGHFRGNFKSKNLQKKLGFTYFSSHLVKTSMGTNEVDHVYLLVKEDYLAKGEEKKQKPKGQLIKNFDIKKAEDFTYKMTYNNCLIFIKWGLLSYDSNIYIGSDLLVIDGKKEISLKILRDTSFILVENDI
ncbi:MAG: GNAT family N-acetyltransferase [Anaerococcus sp.]|nr:GNAT family N-acetyltransferase [Anaerococcus sp.]